MLYEVITPCPAVEGEHPPLIVAVALVVGVIAQVLARHLRVPGILLLLLAQKDGKAQVPPENMAQCQGGLWVAEREWLDYVSYCPDLDPVIISVITSYSIHYTKLYDLHRAFPKTLHSTMKAASHMRGSS